MKQLHRTLGADGEEAVAQYLIEEGFTILARNYRIKGGELDIVARRHDLLVCVEVKTRTNPLFPVSEVITPRKQRLLAHALQVYRAHHFPDGEYTVRFDVAVVAGAAPHWSITYYPHAFEIEEML